MYAYTKLSPNSIAFLNQLASRDGRMSDAFLIAVGYAASRRILPPPQETKDFLVYYRLNYGASTRRILGEINEVAPFSIDKAEKHAVDFANFRYRTQLGKGHPLAFRPEHAIEDFFGISEVFPEETISLLKSHSAAVTRYISDLICLFNELEAQQKLQEEKWAKTSESMETVHDA